MLSIYNSFWLKSFAPDPWETPSLAKGEIPAASGQVSFVYCLKLPALRGAATTASFLSYEL